jgi:hypothetical protein
MTDAAATAILRWEGGRAPSWGDDSQQPALGTWRSVLFLWTPQLVTTVCGDTLTDVTALVLPHAGWRVAALTAAVGERAAYAVLVDQHTERLVRFDTGTGRVRVCGEMPLDVGGAKVCMAVSAAAVVCARHGYQQHVGVWSVRHATFAISAPPRARDTAVCCAGIAAIGSSFVWRLHTPVGIAPRTVVIEDRGAGAPTLRQVDDDDDDATGDRGVTPRAARHQQQFAMWRCGDCELVHVANDARWSVWWRRIAAVRPRRWRRLRCVRTPPLDDTAQLWLEAASGADKRPVLRSHDDGSYGNESEIVDRARLPVSRHSRATTPVALSVPDGWLQSQSSARVWGDLGRLHYVGAERSASAWTLVATDACVRRADLALTQLAIDRGLTLYELAGALVAPLVDRCACEELVAYAPVLGLWPAELHRLVVAYGIS